MLCTASEFAEVTWWTGDIEVCYYGTGEGLYAGGLVQLFSLAHKFVFLKGFC